MNKNNTHTSKGRGAPETPHVIWEMPAWAADTLRDSLELDARSASATPDLRAEIRRALSAIVEVQPFLTVPPCKVCGGILSHRDGCKFTGRRVEVQ